MKEYEKELLVIANLSKEIYCPINVIDDNTSLNGAAYISPKHTTQWTVDYIFKAIIKQKTVLNHERLAETHPQIKKNQTSMPYFVQTSTSH